MEKFDLAASLMGGSESAVNGQEDYDVTVAIIDAAIQLLEGTDSKASANKLQQLRDAVKTGGCTVNQVEKITGCEIDTAGTGYVEVTNLQLNRFSYMHPVLFEEYKVGTNAKVINKYLRRIVNKYPAPPKYKGVIYSAFGAALFWSNYKDTWNTCGNRDGDAVAIAQDREHTYLLKFIGNVFTAGLVFNKDVMRELARMYSKGESIVIIDTEDGHKLECALIDGEYRFSFENKMFIMEIEEYAMMQLSMVFAGGEVFPRGHIITFTNHMEMVD